MSDEYITVVLGKMTKGFTGEHLKQLQKRAAKGTLMCECNNPKREPKMTDQDWAQRFQVIDERKVCGVIIDVERAADGHSIIGKFKRLGPLAELVDIDKPDKMLFGLRGLLKPTGEFLAPITYDYIGTLGDKHE